MSRPVRTPGQIACLIALAEISRPNGEMCLHFRTLESLTGLPRAGVRRNVRALARKGLAEYFRGLWSDDGYPAGAGYCVTKAGLAAFEDLPK